jgi:ankyrin repeat protein
MSTVRIQEKLSTIENQNSTPTDNNNSCVNEQLNRACRSGDFNKVQELFKQGVKPTIKNGEDTCLHHALDNYYDPINIQVINLLLEKGIDPNIKGHRGCVAFHQQSHEGFNNSLNMEVIKLLQKYGADIKSKSISGKTLLHYACRSNSEELFMYLIEQGVDPTVVCNYGTTCLHFVLATKNPNFKIINLLLDKYIDINIAFSQTQKTYLHHVCESTAKFECIQLLIEKGLNPNLQDIDGNTCLHNICKFYPDFCKSNGLSKFADLNVIEFLLNNGADITQKNKEGVTCLQAASTHFSNWDGRSLSVSLFLLLKGAPVADIELGDRTTITAKLIKYLQRLNKWDQKNLLKEIEKKIYSNFHYDDISKHYHSFSRKEKDGIFTLFLIMNRNKENNSSLEIPEPLPKIIAKESVGLASILNITPYQFLHDVVEGVIHQSPIHDQKMVRI